MKLDITKNTWISEGNVDFLREGFWAGAYAITLQFSGGACPSDEFIVSLMKTLMNVDLPKSLRIVRFTGLFDRNDENLMLLAQSLKQYGFSTQIIIPAEFSAGFLSAFEWKIIRVSKELVVQNGDELWYYPTAAIDLKEPTLPAEHGYLYLCKGRTVSETVKFVTQAKNAWRLL